MFWVFVAIALACVVLTVVQIGRMAWRFLRGDEDTVSGGSVGCSCLAAGGRTTGDPSPYNFLT